MKNIWKELPRPILVQAPMEGVTDTVFRQIIAGCGKPDVFFTEFTNVDAIKHSACHCEEPFGQAQGDVAIQAVAADKNICIASACLAGRQARSFAKPQDDKRKSRDDGKNDSRDCHEPPKAALAMARRLQYSEVEKPIVAQIWGNKPENYVEAVKLIVKMKFNGVDINMGCPVWGVVKKGECAGLINNPELAKKIIEAVKTTRQKLAHLGGQEIPVSVKTRIGYDRVITEEWIGFLLKLGLDAITIHGRTAKNRSAEPANWEEIGKAVLLRNKLKVKTAIIGNGDVKSREEAIEKWKKYKVDGVMIGRGILENPFVFSGADEKTDRNKKLKLLIKHINLFKKTYGENRNFSIMKKFYKTYVNGFAGAKQLREELMEMKTAEETIEKLRHCEA